VPVPAVERLPEHPSAQALVVQQLPERLWVPVPAAERLLEHPSAQVPAAEQLRKREHPWEQGHP